MNTAVLTLRQMHFELRSFRRNRSGMMFTFLFPVMFLVIFSLGSEGRTQQFKGGEIPFLQFFVPGILAYGIIGACYTNLAMRVIHLREAGVLKRVRGTPLPRLAYLGGQIGASVIIALVISAITLVIAVVAYGVEMYASTTLALLVTLIVGAACFCAIGLAITSLVPNADGAPAIVNFSIFPILFISDIFYSIESGPSWLKSIGSLFPIKHFANALQVTFDPRTQGWGFSPSHLAVLTIWGIAAAALAVRKFRWEAGG